MSKAEQIEDEVREFLAPHGLLPLGWFELDERPTLLIGNIGSSLWDAFSSSRQFSDGEPDSLDRWTRETILGLVSDMSVEVRYPFGPDVWPFQDYAKRATGIQQSPIGMLIHPEYGLWTAFRAVLVFSDPFELPSAMPGKHPCVSCVEKPCLNTCPIGAFSSEGYDYMACKLHVGSDAGSQCRDGGCLARKACPVGQAYHYEPAHQGFHMAAYI